MKKIGIIAIIIFMVVFINGCDYFWEEDTGPTGYKYLSLKLDKPYSGEFINPKGPGRLAYKEVEEVEIIFEITEGYEFLDWQGENGDEVEKLEREDNKYKAKIIMDKDKEVIPEVKIKDFMVVDKEPGDGEEVSYNEIEEIIITFNNEIKNDDLPDLEIKPEGEDNEIDYRGEMENNQVILELRDYLDFGKEYTVNFGETFLDVDGNILNNSADFSFTMEEDKYPPYTPNSAVDPDENDGEVTLVWERVRDKPEEIVDVYAQKYYIYRGTEEDDEENFDKIAEIKDDNYDIPDDELDDRITQMEWIDDDVNLSQETYYYYITAVDENGNESDPSTVRDTD